MYRVMLEDIKVNIRVRSGRPERRTRGRGSDPRNYLIVARRPNPQHAIHIRYIHTTLRGPPVRWKENRDERIFIVSTPRNTLLTTIALKNQNKKQTKNDGFSAWARPRGDLVRLHMVASSHANVLKLHVSLLC